MLNDVLLAMFEDEYYPAILVAEIKQHIEQFSKRIEKNLDESAIYNIADETIAQINEMKPQFEDLGSALDAIAADYIAEAMMMVVQAQGYMEIEMETLIANRAW